MYPPPFSDAHGEAQIVFEACLICLLSAPPPASFVPFRHSAAAAAVTRPMGP